jgi:RimJ/RimL family protein N-acetyltransferase
MIDTLETQRLILSDILLVDIAAYHKNFVDYAVVSELAAAVPWPYPQDGVVTFLESLQPAQGKTRWAWAIHLKSNPAEPIGNIDLRRSETGENRGFWLARKYWGQGIMTEATDAVTDYAFAALGFEKLTLTNALGNTRSRRIKEKAGAVFLRTEPALFVNPAYTQHEVWELTREAWLRKKIIPPAP